MIFIAVLLFLGGLAAWSAKKKMGFPMSERLGIIHSLEGIPMTDEGSDRWSYRASGLTNPATCRIYLNDEISAFGEDIVLQPGAYMEVSPSFPQVEA